MNVYYIVLILLILSLLQKGKKAQIMGWLLWLVMFLMTLLRSEEVGTDTRQYLIYLSEHRTEEYIMTGITLLRDAGVFDERIIITVTSVVTYLFSTLLIIKNRIDIRCFALFFFLSGLFAMGMNVARQVAAITIVAYFIPFVFSDSWKKSMLFFVGIIFASGFHHTALYISYLYTFRFFSFKESSAPIWMIIVTPLLLFNIVPIDNIFRFILPDIYREEYSDALGRTSVTLLGYIYRLVLLFVQVFLIKFIKERHKMTLYVSSVIVANVAIGMDPAVARIFMVNTLIVALVNAEFLMEVNKVNIKQYIPLLVYIAISIYFCMSSITANSDLNNYQLMTF